MSIQPELSVKMYFTNFLRKFKYLILNKSNVHSIIAHFQIYETICMSSNMNYID